MTAVEIYSDPIYQNGSFGGKVNPFTILSKHHVEEIMTAATPKQAAEFAVKKLRELNEKFKGDDTFGAVSEKYLKDFEIVMSRQRNVMSATKYLFDAELASRGMAVTASKTKGSSEKKQKAEKKAK